MYMLYYDTYIYYIEGYLMFINDIYIYIFEIYFDISAPVKKSQSQALLILDWHLTRDGRFEI